MKVTKSRVERLIHKHLIKYRGKTAIEIPSVMLDFKQTFIFKGITKSGNVMLGEIYAEGPDLIRTRNRIGKVYERKGRLQLSIGRGTSGYILRL